MRLIDADALIRRWCGMKCGCERDECGREIEPCIVVMAIEEAPTVDAAEVVRCKECKHKQQCQKAVQMITHEPTSVTIGYKSVDYCSCGERP